MLVGIVLRDGEVHKDTGVGEKITDKADNVFRSVQLLRDTVLIVKGEDKIITAMSHRRTEDDGVDMGTERGELK